MHCLWIGRGYLHMHFLPHTHSQSLNESQTRELLNSSGSALSSTSVLFPQLLELIVDVPLKLPVLHDLLSQNKGLSLHPNPRSLNLAVWKISADQNLQSSFLQKLPNIWNIFRTCSAMYIRWIFGFIWTTLLVYLEHVVLCRPGESLVSFDLHYWYI